MSAQNRPIVVLAGQENHEFYGNFSIEGETLLVYSLKEGSGLRVDFEADIFLIDCELNSVEGLDLLKEIKSRFPHTPVVFVTAVSSESMVLEAFRSGAIEYFKKPVVLYDLENTIENVLRAKRGDRERRLRFERFEGEPLSLPVTTSVPPNILRAVQYIEHHLSGPISLKELADEAGMSLFHFCRVFKWYTGMKTKSLVTALRIRKATQLMALHEGFNISMLAARVGFNSASTFSEAFKRLTGVTPRSYKSRLMKRKDRRISNGEHISGAGGAIFQEKGAIL